MMELCQVLHPTESDADFYGCVENIACFGDNHFSTGCDGGAFEINQHHWGGVLFRMAGQARNELGAFAIWGCRKHGKHSC